MSMLGVVGGSEGLPCPERVRSLPGHSESTALKTDLARRLAEAGDGERVALLRDAAQNGAPLDLSGADLRRIDLRPGVPTRGLQPGEPHLRPSPFVLDGANLAGAMLSGANLFSVSLRGARLDGALLVGCNLAEADLSGASLRSANLTGARLTGADLTFADLRGASLLTADLSVVSAEGADLRDALLLSASLDGAELRSADLRWARLTGASLVRADIRDARFEGAALASTDFAHVTMSPSTDFGMAFLHRARFSSTALSREHIRGVVGEEITNYALARDTYRDLAVVFADAGRTSDAVWALRRASRMAVRTHRPDRAARYHDAPRARSSVAMAAFYVRHAALWLAGPFYVGLTCARCCQTWTQLRSRLRAAAS